MKDNHRVKGYFSYCSQFRDLFSIKCVLCVLLKKKKKSIQFFFCYRVSQIFTQFWNGRSLAAFVAYWKLKNSFTNDSVEDDL